MTTPPIDPHNDPHIITLWSKGVAAKAAGRGVEDCPYDEGGQAWGEWMAGFNGDPEPL